MIRSDSPRIGTCAFFAALLAITLSLLALPAGGRAAEATAVFLPGSQSFAPTIVGQRTPQQLFQLRDEGPEPIHVSSVAIAGADSGEFSIESTTCAGANLASGESCSVNVSFAPTHGGGRAATLEAVHDGEGSPTTAALSGTGLRQELTVSPLVFPATTKFMTSEEQLTVSNQSDVGVTIFGTSFEGPGSGSFGTNGSNCSGLLGVGMSCTIEVRFNPQSEGEQSAFLRISAEGPGGSPAVPLSGLGAAPQLRFEPEGFDFGLTQTNEGGAQTRMVLRNVGPAATQVGIETSGGAGAFSIGESDCFGTTLAIQGTCSVQADFRPNGTGSYVGVLRANSAGATFDAELSGRGGAAHITASTNPLDFGSAAVGSRGEPRTVTFENSGDLPGGFFIA
ncbi:MAG TPA: choice-of-anchor D domain-containing protein, partial [Solirubrobacterales bacterium]